MRRGFQLFDCRNSSNLDVCFPVYCLEVRMATILIIMVVVAIVTRPIVPNRKSLKSAFCWRVFSYGENSGV